jgi:hypothetical protein
MWLLVVVTGVGAALLFWVGRGVEDAPLDQRPAPLALDVNTVPQAVLLALPRIGPGRARDIVEERAKRPFSSLKDLEERVPGIGPTTVAALRPYLTFGEPEKPDGEGSARPDHGAAAPLALDAADHATNQSSY